MSNRKDALSCAMPPVPAGAAAVIDALEHAGFEAWAVGGFVRDGLLGRACSDVDIASNAPWRETKRICEARGMRVHETGTAHGTVTVVSAGEGVEVTTYRTDGAYRDARHPSRVSFVSTIEEDLARRDFTMNALAYHPERGLVDPFGGAADIRGGIVRAVGDPEKRFSEDALRILRACRFSAELGYRIDSATFAGMLRTKGLLSRVSAERTAHELDRLLMGAHAGDALLATVDVLAAVLPELVAMKGFEQHTPYHVYDVLEHTARVIDGTSRTRLVRWAALFHDMGKPATFFTDLDGTGHFYGHAAVSVLLARGIMSRLKFSPAFSSRVLTLVKHHDEVIEAAPRAVKRALVRLEGDVDLFRALCDLKRGDARGQAPRCAGRVALADELERTLDAVLASRDAFSLRSLAVDGRDVMSLGCPQGPRVGEVLRATLDAVVEGSVRNEREALRAFARELIDAVPKDAESSRRAL